MFEDIGPELEANDDRQQRQSGAGGCRNPGEVVVGVRRQLAEAAVESREAQRAAYGKEQRRRPPHAVGVAKTPEVNDQRRRSEEHTSELPSLMRTSYAVF